MWGGELRTISTHHYFSSTQPLQTHTVHATHARSKATREFGVATLCHAATPNGASSL